MAETHKRRLARLLLDKIERSKSDKNILLLTGLWLELTGKRPQRPQQPDTMQKITHLLGLEHDGRTGHDT